MRCSFHILMARNTSEWVLNVGSQPVVDSVAVDAITDPSPPQVQMQIPQNDSIDHTKCAV